jgi:hypothetical protein
MRGQDLGSRCVPPGIGTLCFPSTCPWHADLEPPPGPPRRIPAKPCFR